MSDHWLSTATVRMNGNVLSVRRIEEERTISGCKLAFEASLSDDGTHADALSGGPSSLKFTLNDEAFHPDDISLKRTFDGRFELTVVGRMTPHAMASAQSYDGTTWKPVYGGPAEIRVGGKLFEPITEPTMPKVRNWSNGPGATITDVMMSRATVSGSPRFEMSQGGIMTRDECTQRTICVACERVMVIGEPMWVCGQHQWCSECVLRRTLNYVERELGNVGDKQFSFKNGFSGDLSLQLAETQAKLAEAEALVASLSCAVSVIEGGG